MPLTRITQNVIGTGDLFTSTTADEDYLVAAGVLVQSTTDEAFFLVGNDHDLEVRGTVLAADIGAQLGNAFVDSGNRIHVTGSGEIAGAKGTLLVGSSSLLNEGEIRGSSGWGAGFATRGTSAAQAENHGLITGTTYGVLVDVNSEVGTSLRLTNHGTIRGELGSFSGSFGTERIVNRGVMAGDVILGANDDLFDNRGGQVRRGEIFGGDGADRFLPGAGAETFDGGSGVDTLDFRSSAGLRVALPNVTGTGLAAGDSYVGIENIWGSQTGDDMLIGNGLSNVLRGGGGVDLLRGALSNDVFEYLRPSEGGDRILDFSNAVQNSDFFRIDASGFGGGLSVGILAASQFRARASNLAFDANDRFIFRTTDATLWFDRDGSAAGGPVLIADLQPGAVVTSADILLV